MAFIVEPRIWELFPGMTLVVAVGAGLDNRLERPEIRGDLEAIQRTLQGSWGHENAQSHPRVAAWRDAMKRVGVSGKKFPSSIEALARRVLGGGEAASINPLVDFYNFLSLKFVVPFGAWDLDELSGDDIHLKITRGGEPFTELASGKTVQADAGEVGYADANELVTRHFVWRQAERGKITPATKRFFAVSEILASVDAGAGEAVREAFVDGVRARFGIEARAALMRAPELRWDW